MLTKEYTKLREEYLDTKASVEYLEQEVKMLRLIIEDMRIDIQMCIRRSMENE